jgi:hypothetical protein
MFRLGDLVKTKSKSKEATHVSGFCYSLDGEELVDMRRIIAGKSTSVPVGQIGIIIYASGTINNKWFMVHFSQIGESCWLSPVCLSSIET